MKRQYIVCKLHSGRDLARRLTAEELRVRHMIRNGDMHLRGQTSWIIYLSGLVCFIRVTEDDAGQRAAAQKSVCTGGEVTGYRTFQGCVSRMHPPGSRYRKRSLFSKTHFGRPTAV